MRSETCPDQAELQDLLLGRSAGEKRIELEEHYLSCPKCAANSESIAVTDDLTQALLNKSRPSGIENELQSAITQAKTLARLLDTVADQNPIAADVTSGAELNSGRNERQCFNFLAPPQQEDEIGRFANYRILEVLGIGGMGIVFRAEDHLLKRVVALKVMKPAVAAKPESKSRFIREAQATAALSHDHIVQIYQVGEERGTPFIAMQYLAGQSLQAILDKPKKLRQLDVARIGAEVASGLSVAHEKGLIHRDIKPDNIWIEAKTYRAKILDFGLARDLSAETELTQSGVILGTPSYMAPEQIAGQELGARCDLFSLGCVLYYLACGQRAFESPNIAGLLHSISNKPAVPIEQRASGLHPQLAKLIMQLLEKDPKQRPADAAMVARALKQIQVDLRAKQRLNEQAITSQPTLSLKASKASKPPRSSWPLIALGGAAFFALLLGTIVLTIRNRNGQETTIRVPDGIRMNVDAQPDSEVSIREVPNDVANAKNVERNSEFDAERAISGGESMGPDVGSDGEKYPPLEQWLVGRKQLTVAQDGSAQFTTIQDALNALQTGEVVRILDKGPYREALRWENKMDCGLIATSGATIELSKWSTDTPEDKNPTGHRFLGLKDVRVHGIDFLCSIDFTDTRHLIMCGGVDGLCMERCVVAAGGNGTKGVVQGIVIYSNGWARDGANPADFKGNCIRNCVIATNWIVLLEGGGTTYFSRNLMMFGPAIEDERYASGLATYHSKVLHTLVFSENVMVHHGGAAQFFFHGDPDTASRIVLRHNTFHGKIENLAVIYEHALAQQFEFVNNLGVHSSNLVYSDPKFLRSSKFRSSGNQSLTSEESGGSQLSLFTATPWKVISLSPLDRNAWRIDSQSQGTADANQAPGALPFGPAGERDDWFTELQYRFKATLTQMTEEARDYWSRPLDVSPK
jgi:serine/threonine protein kinase